VQPYSGDYPIGEIQASLRPAEGEHYREMARKLRAIAREAHFAGARREILKLATRYDLRAALLDRRAALNSEGHGDDGSADGGGALP
jgi:hypothetical protein